MAQARPPAKEGFESTIGRSYAGQGLPSTTLNSRGAFDLSDHREFFEATNHHLTLTVSWLSLGADCARG